MKTFIARNRRNILIRKLNSACLRFNYAFENLNYNSSKNGESRVIKILSRNEVNTVFDVGANEGKWASIALDNFEQARIHSFELVPPTFKKLEKAHGKNERVSINNFGLSNESKEISIKYYPGGNNLSSIYEFPHDLPSKQITCKVMRGDDYCESHSIKQIDFLKIDVEGAEMDVLKGFENMLRSSSIGTIQFEYGKINLITKVFLKDFHDYLGQFNYKVGKIFPNHVDFTPYNLNKENFLGPNFLAVPEEDIQNFQ